MFIHFSTDIGYGYYGVKCGPKIFVFRPNGSFCCGSTWFVCFISSMSALPQNLMPLSHKMRDYVIFFGLYY